LGLVLVVCLPLLSSSLNALEVETILDMKTFNEWLESHLEDNPKDHNLEDSELMDKFNAYIKTGLKKNDEPNEDKQKRQPLKGFDDWNKDNQKPLKGFEQITSLLSHRDNLRDNTAYPILRIINLLNSLAIVLISLIWGGQVGDEALVIFGIVGVVVAILSYSLTSVFFDIADSNINTSKNSERKG